MPDAPVVAPAPVAAPSPAPAAGALGTVPMGFSNIPSTPSFKRGSTALRSGKYDAPSADDKKPAAPVPPVAEDKVDPNKVEVVKPAEDAPVKEGEQKVEGDQTKTPVEGEKKKVSPWRLVDEWKEKATRLEKELAEAKTKRRPMTQKSPSRSKPLMNA